MKKVIIWSGNVVEKYFRSFDNEPVGYSRTKLVAYAFAAMTMIIEWVWLLDAMLTAYSIREVAPVEAIKAWDLLELILLINVSTILSLLGIKAYFKKKDEKKVEQS